MCLKTLHHYNFLSKCCCGMWCSLLCFCPSAAFLQRVVKVFFGCVAAVGCGVLYAVYLSTYHDRTFWFSTRQVGWLTLSSLTRIASVTILPYLIKFKMCLRSWSVKSPSKQEVASIITTLSTCWQPRPLKEVLYAFSSRERELSQTNHRSLLF